MMVLNKFKVGTQLTFGYGLALIMMLILGLVAIFSLKGMNNDIDRIASKDWVKARLAMEIESIARDNYAKTLELFIVQGSAVEKIHAQMELNKAEITKNLEELEKLLYLPEGKAALAKIKEARGAYVESFKKVGKLLQEQNRAEATRIYQAETTVLLENFMSQIDKIVDLQKKLIAKSVEESEQRYNYSRNAAIAVVLIALAFSALFAFLITRSITRPLSRAVEIAEAVKSGDLENQIEVNGRDETAQLLSSLKDMQEQLRDRLERERAEAEKTVRVKQALDKCSTNVMIADRDGNIVYTNESVTGMLIGNEGELRKSLPQFDARKIVGANFDLFHKNPAHQRNLLANLRGTYKTEIQVGVLHFRLIANPILDEHGERVGTVVEWLDRTNEVKAEREVAEIVRAANEGDFSKRLDLGGKEGFFKQLAEGINSLLQTSEVGLNDVVRVLGALARGDLTDRITGDYQGTFGQLKDDSNATVAQLTSIAQQIKESTDSINVAAKEIAQGNSDLSSRTEEQAASLEETAASMEELTSTVKQNAENAKQANGLVSSASVIAKRGGEVVGNVVHTMNDISASSQKIADIIGVIDGIAFQTNILALNAAVEAARAGEQGTSIVGRLLIHMR